MFCGGRGWREEGSGDRKLFIVRVSFYLWETSARTITESVVSRCVNVWTFFSTLKQYDGELCRAPWFNLNKDQKCTKWNRLRAGAVWPLEDPELWSPQAKIRLFFFFFTVLSLLHWPLRLVFVPHFSSVSLTFCFHETSLPQLKRSGEISPDQRADFSFSPGLVWHKNHSTWDVSLFFRTLFFEGLIHTEPKIWHKILVFWYQVE